LKELLFEVQVYSQGDFRGSELSASRFITSRCLINVNAAIDRLRGDASASPITQKTAQCVLALSNAHDW
jgi:outer membrane scaffolding protein for murein synthesis (MipA/OmpV family)